MEEESRILLGCDGSDEEFLLEDLEERMLNLRGMVCVSVRFCSVT